jgi:hypothetical protein
MMRATASFLPCLFFLGCTPETDLKQVQAGVPPTENTNGSLSSPSPDLLAGKLVEPPSGATGIATNLTDLVVAFPEPVAPAGTAPPFLLRSTGGAEMPLALGAAQPCAKSCYEVVLAGALAPATLHTLEVVAGALLFLDGKPTPAGSAGVFSTAAAADAFAPRIVSFAAEVVAGCLAVQLVADEPVRVEIVVTFADQRVAWRAGEVASTLEVAERLPAEAANASAQVMATVADRAGNSVAAAPLAVVLPPPLPRVFVTEVLANPAGSETTQEFVEIYNAGSEAVSLGGLIIADKTGRDTLPEAILTPGAFGLIVAEKYDPAAGGDVPPREGTAMLPVPGRIGSDGLANTGEPVRLLTAGGDVVSQYGGFVDVNATAWSGKSVKRTTIEACDGPTAWTASPSAATPGW